MMADREHLVLVNVDAVQLVLLRASRAAQLLRLFDFEDDADKLDEAAALLQQAIEENRRERKMNTFWKIMALLAVMVLVFVAAPTVAQEVTETPIPVVVTINGEPADAVLEPIGGVTAPSVWPIIAIVGLLLMGVIEAVREYARSKSSEKSFDRFFERWAEMLERKDTRDYGEKRFTESALTVQDWIKAFGGILQAIDQMDVPVLDKLVHPASDYIDSISDGEPNDPKEPGNAGPLPPIDSAGRSYTPNVKPGDLPG